MLSYTIRRLLVAVPTLLAIITVAFFMMRLAPGGPFDQERSLPAAIERNIAARYNLDQPLIVQYAIYLGNVLQGDLGPSIKDRNRSVNRLLSSGFPASLMLGGSALLLAILAGLTLGATAAVRQNGWGDHAVMIVANTGIAVPNFVMAPLLSLVFGLALGWLPTGGWRGPEYMVLPIIALALPQIAYVARLTRGSMVEVLRQNYIRTAQAKGLPHRKVLWRHAMKPALIPVISYLGPAAAGLVTGSIVIETIFQLPGIGRYFVERAIDRDYPVVMGTVILYGGIIILLNLAVDVAYGWLDPRVRYH